MGKGFGRVPYASIFSRPATIPAPVLNTVQDDFYPQSEINTREVGGGEVGFEGETNELFLGQVKFEEPGEGSNLIIQYSVTIYLME